MIDNVIKLQVRFDPEPNHSSHVAVLSLQLFDELAGLHNMGFAERLLLHSSALLHDIGYSVDGNRKHHKNSMKLIMKWGIPGFSDRDTTLIANIARYHRKSLPNPNHTSWATLNEEEQNIVVKLASLLRICDGLDRTHRSLIHHIGCKIGPDRVTITLYHVNDIGFELYAAEKKSDLFRKTYKTDVLFYPVLYPKTNNFSTISDV